jgi:hypothetical protein
MKHESIEEENFVTRLASIESALDQFKADFEATTWRKSSVVDSCVKLAQSELRASIEKFIEDHRYCKFATRGDVL